MSIDFSEADRGLMRGVIELHVHAMPDIFDRPYDQITLANQARNVGYRAILFKCHSAINADCATLVDKIVPGIQVFGGVVLNHAVGGLNPQAVDAAIGLGAKEIWMPTMNAAHHIEVFGMSTYPWHKRVKETGGAVKQLEGITILASDGKILPEVQEILCLIADADVILGTGHLSLEEVLVLIKTAEKMGVKKILVTHSEWEATNWPVEAQVQMAEMGATLEHCINSMMPFRVACSPSHMVDAIKQVGVDHCVIATDYGQWRNPHPIDGMRHFIRLLMEFGITETEIEVMAKKNPAQLLGLE